MDESESACREGCEGSCSRGDDASQFEVTLIKLHLSDSQESEGTGLGIEREAEITSMPRSDCSTTPSQKKSVALVLPFAPERPSSTETNLDSSSPLNAAPRDEQPQARRRVQNYCFSCDNRSALYDYVCIAAALLIIAGLFSLPIAFHFRHDSHTHTVRNCSLGGIIA